MASKAELEREERKRRALELVEGGAMRREGRPAMEPKEGATPEVAQLPTPEPSQEVAPVPPAPAADTPKPTPETGNNTTEPPEPFDAFESIGGKRGFAARGWKTKNTFFSPKITTAGMDLCEELGIEWSDLANLAVAAIVDPSRRTPEMDQMLAELRRRKG